MSASALTVPVQDLIVLIVVHEKQSVVMLTFEPVQQKRGMPPGLSFLQQALPRLQHGFAWRILGVRSSWQGQV